MKKIFLATLFIFIAFTVSACSNQQEEIKDNLFNIEVKVYDKDENIVYERKTTTTFEILLEALENIDDLILETEDSQFGAFITSINGIIQEGNYFWNYYVNGDYATLGVSSYKINNNDIFEFRLEAFE